MKTMVWMTAGWMLLAAGCGINGKKGGSGGGDGDDEGSAEAGDAGGQGGGKGNGGGKGKGGNGTGGGGAADLSFFQGQTNALDATGLQAALDELAAAQLEYQKTKVPAHPCAIEDIPSMNEMLGSAEFAVFSQFGSAYRSSATVPTASEFLAVETLSPQASFGVAWRQTPNMKDIVDGIEITTEIHIGGNENFIYGMTVLDSAFTDYDLEAKTYEYFLYDRKAKQLKTRATSRSRMIDGSMCEGSSPDVCGNISESTVEFSKGSFTFAMEIMDEQAPKQTTHDYTFKGAFAREGDEIRGSYDVFFGDGIASLGQTGTYEAELDVVQHDVFGECYRPRD